MKKYLSPVFFVALSLCFALQQAYGMKRPHEEEGDVHSKAIKQNPAIPSDNGHPFFTPHYSFEVLKDTVFSLIHASFPVEDFLELRLVSREWKKVSNYYITSLNLCPRRKVPWSVKKELMKCSGPVLLKDDIIYRNGSLYQLEQTMLGEKKETLLTPNKCDVWTTEWFPKYQKFRGVDVPLLGLENPLFNTISEVIFDFTDFPRLEKLNLIGNTTHTDKLRETITLKSLATTLKSLSIGINGTDMTSSILHLTNLTELNIALTDLMGRFDSPLMENRDTFNYSNCLNLPSLKILTFEQNKDFLKMNIKDMLDAHRMGIAADIKSTFYQHQMDIAEKLFSLIEENEGKPKNSDYQALRRKYEIRVLLPNHYNLLDKQCVSIYPFYPEQISYSKDDMDALMEVTKDIYMSRCAGIIVYKDAINRRHKYINDIINKLLEISGKDLKIQWPTF